MWLADAIGQVVVHFVADEQVLVLRAVHRRGRQHHVGDRRGHAGLSFHLDAQHVVVFPHPGPQGRDLLLQPDIAADRIEVIAHARRAAIVEAEDVLEERRQIRDQRVMRGGLRNSSAILLVHNSSGLPRSLECES